MKSGQVEIFEEDIKEADALSTGALENAAPFG